MKKYILMLAVLGMAVVIVWMRPFEETQSKSSLLIKPPIPAISQSEVHAKAQVLSKPPLAINVKKPLSDAEQAVFDQFGELRCDLVSCPLGSKVVLSVKAGEAGSDHYYACPDQALSYYVNSVQAVKSIVQLTTGKAAELSAYGEPTASLGRIGTPVFDEYRKAAHVTSFEQGAVQCSKNPTGAFELVKSTDPNEVTMYIKNNTTNEHYWVPKTFFARVE